MKEEGRRIPLMLELENRCVYKIRSRNLIIGVWCSGARGFIGIREKFGSKFLFTEYHSETGAPCGTAWQVGRIGLIPKNIPIVQSLGTIDEATGRAVMFDRAPSAEGNGLAFKDSKTINVVGWRFSDSEKPARVRPVSVPNSALFDHLTSLEASVPNLVLVARKAGVDAKYWNGSEWGPRGKAIEYTEAQKWNSTQGAARPGIEIRWESAW